jgi:hypothetical protein
MSYRKISRTREGSSLLLPIILLSFYSVSVRAESLINVRAASWGPGRLDLFAVGASSGALYHKSWNGANWQPSQNGDWENLGGKIIGSPAVVSRGSNRLDVFVVGCDDGALYHKAWDGSEWLPSINDYDRLGGRIVGSPAVASWGPNRLDINSDSQAYQCRYDSAPLYATKLNSVRSTERGLTGRQDWPRSNPRLRHERWRVACLYRRSRGTTVPGLNHGAGDRHRIRI